MATGAVATQRPVTTGHPREGSNLLWLSKGCARQLQRLPFSRQALQGVILRNPHLRLICRHKTRLCEPRCRRSWSPAPPAPRWALLSAHPRPAEPKGTPSMLGGAAEMWDGRDWGVSAVPAPQHPESTSADAGLDKRCSLETQTEPRPLLPLCKQQEAAPPPDEAPLNPTINRELKHGQLGSQLKNTLVRPCRKKKSQTTNLESTIKKFITSHD